MHRKPVLEILEAYAQSPLITPRELEPLERMRAFIQRRADCFERSLEEGHMTGSAVLLNHEMNACLLTHHRKLGLWLQPGGHADGDHDLRRVALKEATEESGISGIELVQSTAIDIDIHEIPARPKEPQHYHYDIRFLMRAPAGARFVVSEESHDLAWVTQAGAGEYNTDDSVLRLFAKWGEIVSGVSGQGR